ncbi:hypothetical protein ACFS7Z_13935 [Pontibacter toksunensis]|uniref:Uncharacterized protein n=1 Tax=Pontibacter toksunensis TaxID=1332631 RepID=A0ABW6BW39_9BACT
MPRHSTIPTLYDDAIAVSTTKLKEWGYLMPNNYQSGTLTWSRNGNTTGSIDIELLPFLGHVKSREFGFYYITFHPLFRRLVAQ